MDRDDSDGTAAPPQHLLGGLNLAILALPGCCVDDVLATKASLEELGVNVQILSAAKGAVPRAGKLDAVQAIANADPEIFDGVVLPGGGECAAGLRADNGALSFIRAIAGEDKPVGAMGESVAALREALGEGARVIASANEQGLEGFLQALRQALAQRRLDAHATASDDLSSAVGEDG